MRFVNPSSTTWGWSRYSTTSDAFNVPCEPPCTEPYARWCGRTGAERPPPTRCAPGMARSARAGVLAIATGEGNRPGNRLGGESPLWTVMTGTTSQRARASAARRSLKEARGKSPARGTRSAYEASTRWTRGHEDPKSDVIRIAPAYMRRVCGEKVARLTLGDLETCLVLGVARAALMGRQKSAEAIVVGA